MWSASSSTVISTASSVDEPLLHEVFEPAGAGHDDVDAGLEGRDLALCETPPKMVVVLRP